MFGNHAVVLSIGFNGHGPHDVGLLNQLTTVFKNWLASAFCTLSHSCTEGVPFNLLVNPLHPYRIGNGGMCLLPVVTSSPFLISSLALGMLVSK